MKASQWWHQANCLGEDLELFFTGGNGLTRGEVIRQYCVPCLVRQECLMDALEYECRNGGEVYGIAGGMTPGERKKLASHRIADHPRWNRQTA